MQHEYQVQYLLYTNYLMYDRINRLSKEYIKEKKILDEISIYLEISFCLASSA